MSDSEGRLDPAFIVGSGRCGSTLLSSMLRAHPSLLSLSELFTVLGPEASERLDVSFDADELLRLLRVPSSDLLDLVQHAHALPELLVEPQRAAELAAISPLLLVPLPHMSARPESLWRELADCACARPRTSLRDHFDALFDWLCEHERRQAWIERSGGSIDWMDQLGRAWPRARFVLLLRDGVATVASMARHPFFRVRLVRSLAMPGIPSVRECMQREIPLERFASYWSAQMMRAERAVRAMGGRVLAMRYERLVASPERELRRLASFLGVAADSRWLEDAAALVQPRTRSSACPEHVSARLDRFCSPGMRIVAALAA